MELNEVLKDLFGRVNEHVHEAVDGLDGEQLTQQPWPGANSIGWLVWHLTRVQDHHIADLLGVDQIWVSDDWGPRFGISSDPHNTGYGHSATDVQTIKPESAQALVDYYEAVESRTLDFIAGITAEALDRIVDKRWDPPVTLGVRLISIADDDIQHSGQAAYARGAVARGD
jgi:uncharacterized damage-inducible protein DinB